MSERRSILARYRVRGKAENTFGELKSTLRAQLPSSPRPKRQYAGKTIERSDPPTEAEWRPQRSPSPARLARLADHARGPVCDAGRLRERLEPRHLPRKGSARGLPRGPARKAHEILHRQLRGKPLGHPAAAAEEVRHARRVARSPAPLPSPANPEAGKAEPWDPAVQTRRKRRPFNAKSPQPTRSSHASPPYSAANSQRSAISTSTSARNTPIEQQTQTLAAQFANRRDFMNNPG